MTKKVLISILVSILLSLCTGFCFAATNTEKINLGNDVSSSINKTMNSVGNAAKDVVGFGEKAMNNVGDAIGNMTNMDNRNNYRNYNNNNYSNTIGGTTNYGTNNGGYNGDYSVTRTSADSMTNNTGMSTTTWMWVIFAISAVIIIAAIWYYAMQGNDKN